MKTIKKIYRLLGSIYFAILLISLAALMVIAGTLIESFTDSHLLAARWTYHHPFFGILLWCFFINILFSALQRWPFKWRHLPFLITHFGLLMIIGGTILKNKIGLQGNLTLLEGASSLDVHLPYTHALSIETPVNHANLPLAIHSVNQTNRPAIFPDLSVKLLAFYPHVKEIVETWFKKDQVFIKGQPEIAVLNWQPEDSLSNFIEMNFEGYSEPWDVIAIKTSHLPELIKEVYFYDLDVRLRDYTNFNETFIQPLKDVLISPFNLKEAKVDISLSLPYSSNEGFDKPHLSVNWNAKTTLQSEQSSIYLHGPQALYNRADENSYLGISRVEIDLSRKKPLLAFVQDDYEDTHLFFFDKHGRVDAESFSATQLASMFAYNSGYGGYTVQAQLPFPALPISRKNKENVMQQKLLSEMQSAVETNSSLAPPLEAFRKACEKAEVNFSETFLLFLNAWKQSGQLLYSKAAEHSQLKDAVENINWKDAFLTDLHTAKNNQPTIVSSPSIIQIENKTNNDTLWDFMKESNPELFKKLENTNNEKQKSIDRFSMQQPTIINKTNTKMIRPTCLSDKEGIQKDN